MEKEILIEVFKNKACDGVATPYDFGCGAFQFWTGDGMGNLVDIRIEKVKLKHYISYESITSEITKEEYGELLLIYKEKKLEFDRIAEEKARVKHNKNVENLMEMYKESISTKRKVLIEKNEKND